jgi:hypothetical protein
VDTLIDVLVLLAPAAIGLVCIAVGSVVPAFQQRREEIDDIQR